MTKKQERAIVFVDGSNFYHGMKNASISPSGLDYGKLSRKLCKDRKLIETRFYIGRIKQERDAESLYKGQRKFFAKLEQQDNVTLFTGRIDKRGKEWVEKAVDVMIATDMVSLAYENVYDVAYLLSADGDFVPAVERVRKNGRKVFVCSPIPGQEIARVANVFIPLNKNFFNGCWA